MEKNDPLKLLEIELIKKIFLIKIKLKKIEIKINSEIKEAYNFAKSSKFPSVDNFEDLNISNKTPKADKYLREIRDPKFDEDQEVVLPKGY